MGWGGFGGGGGGVRGGGGKKWWFLVGFGGRCGDPWGERGQRRRRKNAVVVLHDADRFFPSEGYDLDNVGKRLLSGFFGSLYRLWTAPCLGTLSGDGDWVGEKE